MKKFAMLAMALLVGLSLAAAEAEGEAKKEAKPEKAGAKAGEKAGERIQRKRRGLFALMSEEESKEYRKANMDFRKAVKEAKEDKEAVRKAAESCYDAQLAVLVKVKTRMEGDKDVKAEDQAIINRYVERFTKDREKLVERMVNPPKRGERPERPGRGDKGPAGKPAAK